jgi:hypothetical protein
MKEKKYWYDVCNDYSLSLRENPPMTSEYAYSKNGIYYDEYHEAIFFNTDHANLEGLRLF